MPPPSSPPLFLSVPRTPSDAVLQLHVPLLLVQDVPELHAKDTAAQQQHLFQQVMKAESLAWT